MTQRATGRDVAVVTPWYPNRNWPFRGSFVQAMAAATAPGCDSMTVYYLDGWVGRASDSEDSEVLAAYRALLPQQTLRTTTVGGATLVQAPVPVRAGTYAQLARRYSEILSTVLGGRPLEQPVVHAHVGLRGGWSAVENAAPDARVFVTEHASFLDKVLEEPDSRAMYDEVITRATGFFAVGEPVRRPLIEAFPHHASKIKLIPNPVLFSEPRRSPVRELRRWLYMGNLIELKRVDLLLEAFAKCYFEDDKLSLTIIGGGPMQRQLIARAGQMGVEHAVTFVAPLPHSAALDALREHDLLIHPSRFETFGMTIVEAIAIGTPVLVTRCGGPEMSLSGIETLASEFIDVEDGPDSIVEGYKRFRERFPDSLDLVTARRVLADRYGYEAVGREHHRVWFDDAATGE